MPWIPNWSAGPVVPGDQAARVTSHREGPPPPPPPPPPSCRCGLGAEGLRPGGGEGRPWASTRPALCCGGFCSVTALRCGDRRGSRAAAHSGAAFSLLPAAWPGLGLQGSQLLTDRLQPVPMPPGTWPLGQSAAQLPCSGFPASLLHVEQAP